MATKETRMTEGSRLDAPQAQTSAGGDGVGERVEEFAADLGRLLGLAREKAEGWFSQRQVVSAHLAEIRDTAAALLSKLGASGKVAPTGPVTEDHDPNAPARRRSRPRNVAMSSGIPESAAAAPRKRMLSPEARKAISDAQKARWAKHRRAAKTAR
jgi:hypothetical protein